MEELKPCPHCGGEARVVECPQCNEVFVKCRKCGIMTETKLSREQVVADWNRRAAPENKPLTLEQLRQMDGKPVWVKNISHPEYSGWKICIGIGESHCYFSNGAAYEINHYGKTWLAYARRPEDA